MGSTHALMGLAAGLASAPYVCSSPGEGVVWAAACTGTALLPDLDTPQSLASRAWGFLTQSLALVVGAVTGGHRKWSHHVIAAPIAGVVIWAAGFTSVTTFAAVALLTGISLAGVTRIVGKRVGPVVNLIASWVIAYQATTRGLVDMDALACAAVLGVLVHIAGDALTAGGVPSLWDSSKRLSVSQMRTGGVAEKFLVTPGLAVLCVVLWPALMNL